MHVQADHVGMVVRLLDHEQDNPVELSLVGQRNGCVSLVMVDRDSGNTELGIVVAREELLAALAVTMLPRLSVDAPDGGEYVRCT